MIDVCFGILMDLLKTRKVTARYLSDKYEISIRSVYRYIDVLSGSGVPVFTERGRGGGVTIADNYRLPATLLTKDEQSDVLSALSLYKGANPARDVDAIRDKLLSVNTSDDAKSLIMSGDKLILEGVIGDEKLYRAKIEPLSKAVDDQKKVTVVYHDRGGEITTRTIHPHAFVLKDFIWYVYAFCELRQSFRMFKISRIEKLKVTDEPFDRKSRDEFTPWNLSPETSQSIIILLYVKEEARYGVEEWLGVECVKPQKNKSFPYVASSQVAFDDTLIPKILSYGSAIKVLEPQSLVKDIVASAHNISTLYD